MIAMINDIYFVLLWFFCQINKKTLFALMVKKKLKKPLGEEKAVSYRLMVPTRIANLTRTTNKMPTTKNSVVLVVDCISFTKQ